MSTDDSKAGSDITKDPFFVALAALHQKDTPDVVFIDEVYDKNGAGENCAALEAFRTAIAAVDLSEEKIQVIMDGYRKNGGKPVDRPVPKP